VNNGRVTSNANEETGGREMHKYQNMEYGSHQISTTGQLLPILL
jgi:hypothetical protein